MEGANTFSRVGMHVMRGCLIVPIQIELYDEVLQQLQRDILNKVNDTGVKGVIIDVSVVEIIDSFIAQIFVDICRMTALIGAQTILIGIRPALAGALTDLGIGVRDIHTALTLDHAISQLEPVVSPATPVLNVPEEDMTHEDAEYWAEDEEDEADLYVDEGQ
ncbi:STAS domain-containing protein [Thalassospira alkalitolerans]|uniref:STAS domain-containing protein n=2 Tax=Thalassospira alkalitolerans TaxID=1293890 RepID=UPI003AA8A234